MSSSHGEYRTEHFYSMDVFIVERPSAFLFHLSHLTNLNFISSQKQAKQNSVAKKLFDQESKGKVEK